MKNIKDFSAFLAAPTTITITTHASPDADALGSSLAFYHYLKKRGHEVFVITPTGYPDFLNWMKGNDDVIINDDSTIERIKNIINRSSLICCLDFSSLNRIKNLGELVEKSTAKKLLVDHHLNPEHFSDYEFWNQKAAATAELIYDLIILLNGKDKIDQDMAECLYAGIMTDTGSFKHPSTSAKIHRIVAELIDLGANINKVSRAIYDTNSLNRLRFIGYSLVEKLTVDKKAKLAYFVINQEEHDRFDLKSGDTEGLVNYALSIKDIVIAAIIMETNGEVKMSFRSIGEYAVNTFASDHFNGGGHKNAAGGISHDNLADTVEKFKNLIPMFNPA